MADQEATTLHGGTLEALQNQSSHSRRLRPPDLEVVSGDENRVPLRADTKLNRRESRMGLRSLFGRTKTAKELEGTSSQWDLARPGGIRASLAEISNWPYGLHAQRSEVALPSMQSRPPSTVYEQLPANATSRQRKPANGAPKQKAATGPVRSRGSLATWDPPPLFQAYPQAIKHVQLPASTHSVDSILRLNERKQSRDDSGQELDDQAWDKKSDKKKKHRRNMSNSSSKYEWTNKIYVLCTSGYLLQYSGEGSFDRLPEKMLQLGKDSAAFASDVIPGRHWVLQVASVMEADGSAASDSRSLFSRLPFRAGEKRNASNFLMVFESAEEMESWITVLRREIEALGGKKNLSETGKPKADDNVLQLKAQPSQRTLVVRDPDRFSRVITQDLPWQQDQMGQSSDDADGSVTVVESDPTPEQSLDDISTTNSVVSHDGRQLDSLRDSANRLSYISSGQRTIITSAGSSPACSPTRDSFASHIDDVPFREPTQEVRPRPNAAAIADRRQSMQTNPFVDLRVSNPPRPHSTYGAGSFGESMPLHSAIPNFSVPHSAHRRYSFAKTPSLESGSSAPQSPVEQVSQVSHPPRSASRRCPPTALPVSRPLSIVADQPSPVQEAEFPTRPSTRHSEAPSQTEATITTNVSPPPTGTGKPEDRAPNSYGLPSRRSSLAAKEHVVLTVRSSPRKSSSMHALRNSVEMAVPPPELPSNPLPRETSVIIPSPPPIPREREERDEIRRCRSSTDNYPRSRSRSPSTRATRHVKRASLQNLHPIMMEKPLTRFSIAAAPEGAAHLTSLMGPPPRAPPSCPPPAPPVSMHNHPPLAPTGHLRVDSQSKALFNRRSMPQLVESPPPAPPPTCALPPIPQKLRVKA